VSRETKWGLLIGLVFIVLFGVILSGRLSAVSEHAPMPVGQSQDHATKLRAIHTNVDPFAKDASPGAADPGAAIVADAKELAAPAPEEAMPAPEHLAADLPAPRPAERGMVAFMPVMVETPTRGQSPDLRPARLELPADPPGLAPPAPGAPPAPAPDPNRKVYIVKPGDTLTKVARQFYGKDGDRLTRQIYEANKATLRDPNRLAVGQQLVIPGVPADAPKPESPKTDTPRSDPPRRDVPPDSRRDDTAYADAGGAGARPPLRIPSLRGGADAAKGAGLASDGTKPGMLFRDHVIAPVRDVSLDDLAQMYRVQSAPAKQPARPSADYTVQAGDTFYGIAAKLYGDGNKYGRQLYLKNQQQVSDPTKLKIGQRLALLDGVNTTVSEMAVAQR